MHKPVLVILFITVLVASVLAFKLHKISKAQNEVEYKSGLKKSVNMYPYDFDESGFSGFNIQVPYSYFVTSDEMLVDYNSQGGMAPPRLILMKGYQVMGERDYWDHIKNNPAFSCIALWSTRSFENADDWNSITQFKSPLTEIETINVGTRSAQLYETENDYGKVYAAFLNINDPDRNSYFIHTCNDKNKEDLIEVLQSLKFRGDIYPN